MLCGLRNTRSFGEASQREQSTTNTIEQMLVDAAPLVRRHLSVNIIALDIASYFMDMISPRLRPVSVALLSPAEKRIMRDVVDTMLAYNVMLKQVKPAYGHMQKRGRGRRGEKEIHTEEREQGEWREAKKGRGEKEIDRPWRKETRMVSQKRFFGKIMLATLLDRNATACPVNSSTAWTLP